jgi:hypothetical protein
MNEFEMRRHLRALRTERTPSRDLWPAIAAGLEPRGTTASPRPAPPATGRRHWAGWAIAASLVGAMVLLWPLRTAHETAAPPELAARAPAVDPLRWQADALRLEYSLAIAQLAEIPLPPELRPAARELKDSEQSLREALRADPGSTYLLGQLRRTYEQQLRLSQLAALG